jgi:hypothetical protein
VPLTEYTYGDEAKEDENSWTCSVQGRKEKCIQRKVLRNEETGKT